MSAIGVLRIAISLAVVFLLVKPLGAYMARVYEGRRTLLDPVLRPLERLLYRLCRIDPNEDMTWQTYTIAMLVFTIAGELLLYGFQRLQPILPLNPQGMGAVSPDLSLNTAMSFTTNTNWQNYGGETTLSYFTQMAGLTVKNFVSAAVGLAIMVALIRGLARRSAQAIGNFWVDTVRSCLYVLLPLWSSWRCPWPPRAWWPPCRRTRPRRCCSRRPTSSRSPTPAASRSSTPRASRRRKPSR